MGFFRRWLLEPVRVKTCMGDMPTVGHVVEFQKLPIGWREDGIDSFVFDLFIAAAEIKSRRLSVFPRSESQSAQGAVVKVVVAE